MNKKRDDFRHGRRALLAMLWLSLGLWECPGAVTNSFPNPRPAEQFVWEQLTNQQIVLTNQEFIDLTNSSAGKDTTNRIVRGRFLEWLLTENGKQLPHDGLCLKNAVIAGPVDLSNVEVPVPVRLVCCRFKENVNLSGAHFDHDLSFAGCLFDGEFHASALRVDGSLELKTYDLRIKWETRSSETPPSENDLINYLGTNEAIQSWSPGHGAFILDRNRVTRCWVIEDARTNKTPDAANRWTNYFDATTWGDGLFLVQRYDDAAAQASNSVMNLTVGPLPGEWPTEPKNGSLDLNYVRTRLTTAPVKNLEFFWNHFSTNLPTGLDPNLEFIRANVLTPGATNRPTTVRWLFDNIYNTNYPDALPLVARWNVSMTDQIIGTNLTLTTNRTGAADQIITTNQIVITIKIIATNQIVAFSQPTIFRQGVWLDRAMIAGKLDAGEVEFRKPVDCAGLKAGDSISMRDAWFDEAVSFRHVQVGYDFVLQDSSFRAAEKFKKIDSYGMSVGGSLIIDGARFGTGAVFEEVSVGKAFRGQYVRFENRDALAVFRGLKVDGSVDFLRAQFAGPANFILSQIKGNFEAKGATFEDDHAFPDLKNLTDNTFTFNTDFGSMQVDGFAIFENVLFARSVSFQNARFGNLYLDGARWPETNILMSYRSYTNDPPNLLRLEGTDFATIRDLTSDHFFHTHAQLVESQSNLLAMLASRSPYSYDIYGKLESYFRREGAPALADDVFVHGKEREGKEASGWAKFANTFLNWTVGYGRQPWKAFCWSLGCIGLSTVFYMCCMVTKKDPAKSPGFWLALLFSLGTFLPIIDLGASKLLEFPEKNENKLLRYWIAVEKILGYILVPLWTLALSGLIK